MFMHESQYILLYKPPHKMTSKSRSQGRLRGGGALQMDLTIALNAARKNTAIKKESAHTPNFIFGTIKVWFNLLVRLQLGP